jgi:hypothetical protein
LMFCSNSLASGSCRLGDDYYSREALAALLQPTIGGDFLRP